jgi:hypothetical protein
MGKLKECWWHSVSTSKDCYTKRALTELRFAEKHHECNNLSNCV